MKCKNVEIIIFKKEELLYGTLCFEGKKLWLEAEPTMLRKAVIALNVGTDNLDEVACIVATSFLKAAFHVDHHIKTSSHLGDYIADGIKKETECLWELSINNEWKEMDLRESVLIIRVGNYAEFCLKFPSQAQASKWYKKILREIS